MQKYKIQIIVGNVYEVEVIARDIVAANDYALGLCEESEMINLDEVERCISNSELIADDEPAVLFAERPERY